MGKPKLHKYFIVYNVIKTVKERLKIIEKPKFFPTSFKRRLNEYVLRGPLPKIV